MRYIWNQFLSLFGIFDNREARASMKDPRLMADFYHYNLPFGIASGLLLCILSFISLVGTYAPFSAGYVLPVINATFVYLVIFITNLIFVFLLYRELLRFHGVAEKRTRMIINWFTGLNMVLASLTFYTTQENSSFFFEYILVTVTILLIPNSRFLMFLRNAILNILCVAVVLSVSRQKIAWQDILDMGVLFVICGFVNWLRWLSFLQMEANKFAAEKKKDELYQESRTDDLTGILNRNALRDDYSGFLGRSLRIALMDIDSFKNCNDTYGHAYGDRLLHAVGSQLRKVFDGSDDYCYRYGGDEFLVISLGGDPADFQDRLSDFSDSLQKNDGEPGITCSIGYLCGTANSEQELRTLIQLADRYLYQAKAMGAGQLAGSLTPVRENALQAANQDAVLGRLQSVDTVTEVFESHGMPAKSWTIAYLDVDRFGEILEELGTREGRTLLENIVRTIFQYFPNDILINREADHFVLISTLPKDDFVQKLHKMQAAVFHLEERHMIVLRAGLLRHEAADPPMDFATGMYRAKYAADSIADVSARREPLCWYNQDMEQKRAKEIFVHNAFPEALQSGYLIPYYQPIVGSLSGTTCGYEALCRWIDPEKGMISPGDFIPYLEKTGEIYHLDLAILERVCRDLRDHQDQIPRNIFVNVNLSQKDFQMSNLPEEILRIVNKYGVSRDQLQLEITESAFADSGLIREAIGMLQKYGFRIWMDDFGVGESSLSAFMRRKVDGVKLDQSFFADVASERTQIIIRSIIDMSHETNCMMIAEGIENLAQLQCARQWGVNFIQGFYFSRPLPLEKLLASPFVGNLTNAYTDRFYQAAAEVHLWSASAPQFYLTEKDHVLACRAVLEAGQDIRVLRADDQMIRFLQDHNAADLQESDCVLDQDSVLSAALAKAMTDVSQAHPVADFTISLGEQQVHGQLQIIAEDPDRRRSVCILNLTNFDLTFI
ncbi:MAG: EAL domain-containing protein [Lachnospiraceae bacterium]